jgi:hypothetical protein
VTDTGDDPRPIGQGVERFLAALGAPPPKVTTDIATCWVDIVGAQLARVTTPGSLRDGVLVVTTTEPAVADHLNWSERTVVDRANQILGTEAIRALRTRVVAE